MSHSHWWRGAEAYDPGQWHDDQQRADGPVSSTQADWWGQTGWHEQHGSRDHDSWQQWGYWNSDSWYPSTWDSSANYGWQSWYGRDSNNWESRWESQHDEAEEQPKEDGDFEENKELEEAVGGRRASLITEATRASSTHEIDDGENARGIKTGKDYIPEFNGRTPMREYERRVRLFEANTQIHPSYQAGKLIERLTDQAWKATETLDIKSLKNSQGVDTLLQHLWGQLEPLEFLRVFQTLNDFYRHFRRPNGQQFTEFDMDFRAQCQRLDEINAGITGVTRAYWFLEKAGLGPELRKCDGKRSITTA